MLYAQSTPPDPTRRDGLVESRRVGQCELGICILTLVLLGCAGSRPVIGWRLPHSNSTEITEGCGFGHWDIWQLLYFRCVQTMTADTLIAYITRDDRSNTSSASSRHGAKRRGGLLRPMCRR